MLLYLCIHLAKGMECILTFMLCKMWYLSSYYQFITPINKSNYTVYTTQSHRILWGKEQEQLNIERTMISAVAPSCYSIYRSSQSRACRYVNNNAYRITISCRSWSLQKWTIKISRITPCSFLPSFSMYYMNVWQIIRLSIFISEILYNLYIEIQHMVLRILINDYIHSLAHGIGALIGQRFCTLLCSNGISHNTC